MHQSFSTGIYLQDISKQGDSYLFLLFLYLRDHGMAFGGTMREFKEVERENIKQDIGQFRKDRTDAAITGVVDAYEITDDEYRTMVKAGRQRVKITKIHQDAMKKYRLKKMLNVNAVSYDLVKHMKNRKNKYNNIKYAMGALGAKSETEHALFMSERLTGIINKIDEDTCTPIILLEDERMRHHRIITHLLNIIYILVPGLRVEDMEQKNPVKMRVAQIQDTFVAYFTHYKKEFEIYMGITKMDKENAIKIISKLLKDYFDMKIVIDKNHVFTLDELVSNVVYLVCPWVMKEETLYPRLD